MVNSAERKRFSVSLPLAYVKVMENLVEMGVYIDPQDAIRDGLRQIFKYHRKKPFFPLVEEAEEN